MANVRGWDSSGLWVAGVRLAQVLRAQRVLSGGSADSLAAAFAVALQEIAQEMGLDDVG